MRLRHTRRTAEGAGSEARIEVLGDRIELLEFTLNEYIDKIDAVATHATRISVDRLTPAIEKLSRVVLDRTNAEGDGGRVEETAAFGAIQDESGEPAQDRNGAGTGELAAIAARLDAMETRVAGLPERIRVATAAPFPSPGAEAKTRSHVLTALSALNRQQEVLRSGIDARLQTIEDLSRRDETAGLATRISDCEEQLSRLSDTVRDAVAATLPDRDPVRCSVDELRKMVSGIAERQAETHRYLVDRLDTLEARLSQPDDSEVLRRLDALGTNLSRLPDRITIATAPPAIIDHEAQRSAASRVVSAVSALSRQQEAMTSTLQQRLEALEHQVKETGEAVPTIAAEDIATRLRASLRDISQRGPAGETSSVVRNIQQRDAKLSVALARIERVLTAIATRDRSTSEAREASEAQAEARSTQMLNAVADLRSEMTDALCEASTAEATSRSALQMALAELLALTHRNSRPVA